VTGVQTFPLPIFQARIDFRPYAVQISPDLFQYAFRATLRHTFFLGIMLRVELDLPSGLIVRARMTKEDYARHGLRDGQEVSFQIRQFRLLAHDSAALGPEYLTTYDAPPTIAEGI
jgi:hypothetical protein